MTLNDILQATAVRLKELWPDRKVRVDEISQHADGSFFVGLTDSEQTGGIGGRFKRTVGVEVLYFLKNRDTMSYLSWAESMYDSFRYLSLDGRSVCLTNCKARNDAEGRYYQFLFDVEQNFVEASPIGEGMETLQLKEEIK